MDSTAGPRTPPDLPAIQALAREDMAAVDALIRRRLASGVVLVNQVAEYIVGAGGKRLRPMLLLLAARALGKHADKGAGPDAAIYNWDEKACGFFAACVQELKMVL